MNPNPLNSELKRVNGFLPESLTNALLLLMVVIVFGIAAYRVRNLTWPHDPDLQRYQGQSQAMVDGDPFADAAYRDVKLWYPPLYPWLVGLIHLLTGESLSILWARIGAYLNIFNIFGFFWLARTFWGHVAALTATGLMLFVTCLWQISWMCYCYSAVAFPLITVSAFYCLAVIAHFHAIRRDSLALYAATGVLYGVIFLGHTAPAFLLIGTFALIEISRLLRGQINWRRFLLYGATAAALTVLVSSPFLYILLVEQRLDYKTDVHSQLLGNTDPRYLHLMLTVHLTPSLLFFGIGLVLLLKRRSSLERDFVLFHTLGLLGLMTAYYLYAAVTRHSFLPFPGHQVVYYIEFWLSLVAGYGAIRTALWFTEYIRRRKPEEKINERAVFRAIYGILGFMAVFSIISPSYNLSDLSYLETSPDEDGVEMAHWIQNHTVRGEVFLSDPEIALQFIVPVNRQVVVTSELFSSPFVDYKRRYEDSQLIYAALRASRCDEAETRMERYKVRYVVDQVEITTCQAILRPVFAHGDFYVYQVALKALSSK